MSNSLDACDEFMYYEAAFYNQENDEYGDPISGMN
jgi:hypothetical protein